jgi:ATP-dependent Clp protease ATP-binding subunit ClpA
MFERFTRHARSGVVRARMEAIDLGHRRVGTGHLLLGMLCDPDALAARALLTRGVGPEHVRAAVVRDEAGPTRSAADAAALAAIGIDLHAVTSAVEETFGEGALGHRPARRRRRSPPFAPDATQALTRSLKEALALGHDAIGTEHVLAAIVGMEDSAGHRVLEELAAPTATLRDAVLAERGRVGRGA